MASLYCLLSMRLAAPSSRAFLERLQQYPHDPSPWPLAAAHRQQVRRQCLALTSLGISALPWSQQPERLRLAAPPAAILFVRGNAELLQRPAVAIVGSRRAAAAACVWAERCGWALAKCGWLVVSGGARGIDAAAHRGAMRAGGATLAYIGSPIDALYPSSNRSLFQDILRRGGAIVSEHPPYATTPKYAHAQRNRFIATHAEALVVAEAAAKSGTLGTARHARRLRRPVWVPPASLPGARDGIAVMVAALGARELTDPGAWATDLLGPSQSPQSGG